MLKYYQIFVQHVVKFHSLICSILFILVKLGCVVNRVVLVFDRTRCVELRQAQGLLCCCFMSHVALWIQTAALLGAVPLHNSL